MFLSFQTKSYDFSRHHLDYDLKLTNFPLAVRVETIILLYVHSKRNMANTSTIKPLVELIIKAISAIRKSQKRLGKTRIYDSIKIFLENCDIDDSLF